MQVTIDIPDEAVQAMKNLHVSPSEYATEIVRAHVEDLLAGSEKIENRPDWQAALRQGREEIARGEGVTDDEVAAWHLSHPA